MTNPRAGCTWGPGEMAFGSSGGLYCDNKGRGQRAILSAMLVFAAVRPTAGFAGRFRQRNYATARPNEISSGGESLVRPIKDKASFLSTTKERQGNAVKDLVVRLGLVLK